MAFSFGQGKKSKKAADKHSGVGSGSLFTSMPVTPVPFDFNPTSVTAGMERVASSAAASSPEAVPSAPSSQPPQPSSLDSSVSNASDEFDLFGDMSDSVPTNEPSPSSNNAPEGVSELSSSAQPPSAQPSQSIQTESYDMVAQSNIETVQAFAPSLGPSSASLPADALPESYVMDLSRGDVSMDIAPHPGHRADGDDARPFTGSEKMDVMQLYPDETPSTESSSGPIEEETFYVAPPIQTMDSGAEDVLDLYADDAPAPLPATDLDPNQEASFSLDLSHNEDVTVDSSVESASDTFAPSAGLSESFESVDTIVDISTGTVTVPSEHSDNGFDLFGGDEVDNNESVIELDAASDTPLDVQRHTTTGEEDHFSLELDAPGLNVSADEQADDFWGVGDASSSDALSGFDDDDSGANVGQDDDIWGEATSASSHVASSSDGFDLFSDDSFSDAPASPLNESDAFASMDEEDSPPVMDLSQTEAQGHQIEMPSPSDADSNSNSVMDLTMAPSVDDVLEQWNDAASDDMSETMDMGSESESIDNQEPQLLQSPQAQPSSLSSLPDVMDDFEDWSDVPPEHHAPFDAPSFDAGVVEAPLTSGGTGDFYPDAGQERVSSVTLPEPSAVASDDFEWVTPDEMDALDLSSPEPVLESVQHADATQDPVKAGWDWGDELHVSDDWELESVSERSSQQPLKAVSQVSTSLEALDPVVPEMTTAELSFDDSDVDDMFAGDGADPMMDFEPELSAGPAQGLESVLHQVSELVHAVGDVPSLMDDAEPETIEALSEEHGASPWEEDGEENGEQDGWGDDWGEELQLEPVLATENSGAVQVESSSQSEDVPESSEDSRPSLPLEVLEGDDILASPVLENLEDYRSPVLDNRQENAQDTVQEWDVVEATESEVVSEAEPQESLLPDFEDQPVVHGRVPLVEVDIEAGFSLVLVGSGDVDDPVQLIANSLRSDSDYNEQTVLKTFDENPLLDTASPVVQQGLQVSKEASLKTKTIYRAQLGYWKGVFSRDITGAVEFRDEIMTGRRRLR